MIFRVVIVHDPQNQLFSTLDLWNQHPCKPLYFGRPKKRGWKVKTVRKIVETSGLKWTDKAPFEDLTLSNALLKPTKLYVKQCLNIMGVKGIRAFSHITGGGLTENIVRTLEKGQGIEINISGWVLPPIFKWLSDTGGVDKFEMLKTFNCGIGMTVIW